jgi:hypothetical protein
VDIAASNSVATLRNTLLSSSGKNASAWGAITDAGYNMCSDGTANFTSGSSFNFTDPKLLPLANNGGPTWTMALAADSPAIDWAPMASAPAVDQRGVLRPYGSGADLGAFEVGPSLSVRHAGTNANFSFIVQAGFGYHIQRSTDFIIWETEETIGPFGTNTVISRSYPATQSRRFYRLTLDF